MSKEETGYKVTQFLYEDGGFIRFVLENSEIQDGFAVRILETEYDEMNDNQFDAYVQPLIEARIDEITIARANDKTKHDNAKLKTKNYKDKDIKFKIKKDSKDKETALKPEYAMQP